MFLVGDIRSIKQEAIILVCRDYFVRSEDKEAKAMIDKTGIYHLLSLANNGSS